MVKSSLVSTAGIISILLAGLPLSARAQEKPTLAVLEFDGFGISTQEVAALSNRLRTNLTQLGTYRIIERGLMQQPRLGSHLLWAMDGTIRLTTKRYTYSPQFCNGWY